ncbi:WD40-repeat-containing domain protein [Boletus reticuloceps]|uniref:WD40-repeat-containing domain protein n=1 Tax=Boletus reticuloceps TaxID=495285 RepID=A0A8I3AA20_9AGAM|nr:WD40-repeat-containing domain protein [Boletus reticuloceps]
MLTFGQERFPLIEIDAGSGIRGVTFAANGEHLVGSGDGVRVWRVEDGERMATMEARGVTVTAVSKDCRYIAAGTAWGEAIVWDTTTHEKVFTHKERSYVIGVDFSSDSSRLVVASKNGTAKVWDVATQKRVLTLDHAGWVVAAKYSPHGGRIATATRKSIHIWNSDDGRLLVNIPVTVIPWYNTGLFWAKEHLWIVSEDKIKQCEASTGSIVSEWPVSSHETSCIAVSKRGEFIAYSTNDTVKFWDTSTHTQLGLIQHSQDIFSIALSPDNQVLAIGGDGGKITVKNLSRITVSVAPSLNRAYLSVFLVPMIFPYRI